MKYLLTVLVMGTALLTACTNPDTSAKAVPHVTVAVPSSDSSVRPMPVKPPTQEQISQSLVAKYDINKDNVVTTDEMLSVTLDGLLRASSKHNKTLSAAEFHLALGDRTLQDKDIDKVFSRVDSNHDGILNEKELTSYVWPSIQALNTQAQKTENPLVLLK